MFNTDDIDYELFVLKKKLIDLQSANILIDKIKDQMETITNFLPEENKKEFAEKIKKVIAPQSYTDTISLKYCKTTPIYILFSGGKGSALTAFLLKKKGYNNLFLYFNDTKTEDIDLYRFIEQTSKFLNIPLIKDSDGRDVWEVFKDNKFMGNSRVDLCSRILKRDISKKFREKFNSNEVAFAIGIDLWESHRYNNAKPNWEPYKLIAPLIDAEIDKEKLWLQFINESKIKEPYLYSIGMNHNNCGGFCVKAGLAHYKNLLEKDRERYLYFEQKENEVYEFIGKKHPFLKKQIKNKTYFLTLREYREFLENPEYVFDSDDLNDFGGCQACAI